MTRFEKLTMIAIAFHRLTLLAVGLHVYKAVSRKVVQKGVKVHATIPKGVVNKSLISGFPRNLRNVTERTRQSGFDEFTYLFD